MDIAWAPAVPPGHTFFSWDSDQFATQSQLHGYNTVRAEPTPVKIHTNVDKSAKSTDVAPSHSAPKPKTSSSHSKSDKSSATKESKEAPTDTTAIRKQITDAVRGWIQGSETKSEFSLSSKLTVVENGLLKWNREEQRSLDHIPVAEWELLVMEVEECIKTRSAAVSQGLHDKYMQYIMRRPEGDRRHGQIGTGHSLYIHALTLLRGIGTKIDKPSALLALHQAAEEGVPEAISLLGYCYEKGDGVFENPQRAVQCYEAALALGDPHASVRLGRCLWEGIPKALPQDRERAPRLIEEGIAQLRLRVARNQDGLPGVSRALSLLHTQMNLV